MMPKEHDYFTSEYRKYTLKKYNSVSVHDYDSKEYNIIKNHPQYNFLVDEIGDCCSFDAVEKAVNNCNYVSNKQRELMQTILHIQNFMRANTSKLFFFDISPANVAIHKNNIILLDPIC